MNYIKGFNPSQGFFPNIGSVLNTNYINEASGRSLDPGPRPLVPIDFPNSTLINRNNSHLALLNKAEEQFERTQNARDVAGNASKNTAKETQTAAQSQATYQRVSKEIRDYKRTLESENKKLLSQASKAIEKQKKDKEYEAVAKQIAKEHSNLIKPESISAAEIEARIAASKPGAPPPAKKKPLSKPKAKAPAKKKALGKPKGRG